MVQPNVYEPRLAEFYGHMEHKMGLPKNVAKGDWRDPETSVGWLLSALRNEVDELEAELYTGSKRDVAYECADIANFAMMIADKVTYA